MKVPSLSGNSRLREGSDPKFFRRLSPRLIATFPAVETAVLHNFIWHERWTWIERTRLSGGGVLGRLFRFHLANGLISIAGNLVLMWFFVSRLRLHYFLANLIAIGMCSLVNFFASDRLVFRLNS